MELKIIVDPGSTHFGNMDEVYRIIRKARECGANAVKFQLFKNLPPNIEFPRDYWVDAAKWGEDEGIEVFASVWDFEAVRLLKDNGAKSIKFSYSQSSNYALIELARKLEFDNYYFSYDLMNRPKQKTDPEKDIWLYCIPEYPVKYVVDFDCLFTIFDGFSDHTMGIDQSVKAAGEGARYIEKHFTLDLGIDCPDQRFAIIPYELKMLRQRTVDA